MEPYIRPLMMGAAGTGGATYIEDVFSTWLYTGNGSTQTITNGIDLAGKGGLVWVKGRNQAYSHYLFDTQRGSSKRLSSDLTDAEQTSTSHLTSFNSDGFSLGSNFTVNGNGSTWASWTFRKAAKFFDVVTYTGNGANRTIAHNLGSVPGCIIVKSTSQADNWKVYHRSLTSNAYYLLLDSTAAQSNAVDLWNSTTPTATEFSIGSSGNINTNGATYVAYLFAHDTTPDGLIQCGSFTADGSFNASVTLGWEPQFLLIKRTDSTGSWALLDTMRGGSVASTSNGLEANTSNTEGGGTANYAWNPTATGFQFRGSLAGSGATYIYIAIRRGPMRTPTDATKVFAPVATSANPVTTGFPVDLSIATKRSIAESNYVFDRLRGSSQTSSRYLVTDATAAEGTFGSNGFGFDNNSGFVDNGILLTASSIFWNFRRAPGFFDVVAYTGNGSAVRTVTHNLSAVPELMIIKSRSNSDATFSQWAVGGSAIQASGANRNLFLNATDAAATGYNPWSSTLPTSTVFTVSDSALVNANTQTYIAYLFASCPGVSKCGSYTGTGTTLQVNCGFTSGARFVLIKRTDSTGDWYVWDSARGIVAGNDPYLLLNSTAAEVTSTDYVDTFSAGFEISSTAPAAINANGGTFIFLAIA